MLLRLAAARNAAALVTPVVPPVVVAAMVVISPVNTGRADEGNTSSRESVRSAPVPGPQGPGTDSLLWLD
jgi:hypothetical protein